MKSKNEQIKRTKFFTRLAIVKREFGLSKKMGNATMLTQSCYNFTDRWKKEFKDTRKAQRKLFQCVTRKKPKFVYETQAIQNLIREPEISSSEEERKVNALASGADEGRD